MPQKYTHNSFINLICCQMDRYFIVFHLIALYPVLKMEKAKSVSTEWQFHKFVLSLFQKIKVDK